MTPWCGLLQVLLELSSAVELQGELTNKPGDRWSEQSAAKSIVQRVAGTWFFPLAHSRKPTSGLPIRKGDVWRCAGCNVDMPDLSNLAQDKTG